MKLAKIVLAIGLSCLGFSIYAADQVVKEDTTPPGSEGPLTVNQIPPVYTQPAPAVAPQQPTETRQPVMPSNTPTPPPVETVPAPQTTPQQPLQPQQPEQPGAQPATPPQNTEQPVTQQTNQPPVMQQ